MIKILDGAQLVAIRASPHLTATLWSRVWVCASIILPKEFVGSDNFSSCHTPGLDLGCALASGLALGVGNLGLSLGVVLDNGLALGAGIGHGLGFGLANTLVRVAASLGHGLGHGCGLADGFGLGTDSLGLSFANRLVVGVDSLGLSSHAFVRKGLGIDSTSLRRRLVRALGLGISLVTNGLGFVLEVRSIATNGAGQGHHGVAGGDGM